MDDTNEHGLTPLSPLDGSMDPDGLMTRDVLDSALNAIYSSGFDLGVPDDLGSLYGAPDVHDVRPPETQGTGTGTGSGSGAGSNPKHASAETSSKPADAVGKRGRPNLNQAEVQKRYRERKKSKMAELEKQVEDLRATVMELEKAKKLQGGDSTGSKDGLLNSGGPSPPNGTTTTNNTAGDNHERHSSDDDTTGVVPVPVMRPFTVGSGANGDSQLTERIIKEVDHLRKERGDRGCDDDGSDGGSACENYCAYHAVDCIEASETLRRGMDGLSANGKFKNYTEAEIWWGGVHEVYSKFVRVMRELMDAGAKDDDLRVVIDSMYDVVSVARESRSDLAVVSTITRINFNMQQQMASEGMNITDECRTACALLSKSVVDSRMQSQNTEEVIAKLENELPPKDLRIIVDWYDAYMAELMKIGMCRFEMIGKYERTKLTKDVDVLYGIPISEVTKEEGPYAEDAKKIVESLQKEMIMYKNGIRDLLQKLPVRSAAQLYLSAYPSAPDPITLAFELKKKLEPKSREVWADEKDNTNAASP